MSHLALLSPDGAPASAVMAFAFGGREVWRLERRVPFPPAVEAFTVELTAPVPAGTSIFFHVHNHGANSYYLLAVDVLE